MPPKNKSVSHSRGFLLHATHIEDTLFTGLGSGYGVCVEDTSSKRYVGIWKHGPLRRYSFAGGTHYRFSSEEFDIVIAMFNLDPELFFGHGTCVELEF